MRRKRGRLTYKVPAPQGPFEAMADAMAHFAGRRSLGEWQRACRASLRASRARRGLPVAEVEVRLRVDDRASEQLREFNRRMKAAARVGISTEEATDRMRLLAGKRSPR